MRGVGQFKENTEVKFFKFHNVLSDMNTFIVFEGENRYIILADALLSIYHDDVFIETTLHILINIKYIILFK